MTKFTYYMYPCDTCCMIREIMEINGLNQAKCQNQNLRDKMGIMEMFNENKTKKNSDLLLQKHKKRIVGGWFSF